MSLLRIHAGLRTMSADSFGALISGAALLCPCSALTDAIPLTLSSPAMVRCPPNPVQEDLLQDLTFCFMSVTPSDRLSLL